MQKSTDRYYAGFWTRAAAYLVDRLLVGAACLFVRFPALIAAFVSGESLKPVLFRFTSVDIICYIVSVLYFSILTCSTGGTLGKHMMKISVVTKDGTRVGFFRALYRETVGRFIGGFMWIAYIVVACDSQKRGFQDMLSDTRVIYSLGQNAYYSLLPPDPESAKSAPNAAPIPRALINDENIGSVYMTMPSPSPSASPYSSYQSPFAAQQNTSDVSGAAGAADDSDASEGGTSQTAEDAPAVPDRTDAADASASGDTEYTDNNSGTEF